MSKVCVVTAQSFPSGMASNNRILSYSKGLVEIGNEVDVLSINKSNEASGEITGIKYSNLGGQFNNKLLIMISGIYKLISSLLRSNYGSLIVVSNNAILLLLLYMVCKIKKIVYIQEKSEFPFVLNSQGIIKNIFSRLYVKFIYRIFDGMIIMTQPLMDYFKDKTSKKCQLFLMPMTVDVTRFDEVEDIGRYSNCITYCGSMGGNKDGVKNLIESFSFIKDKYKDINLLLLGTASPSELNDMKQYANSLAPGRVVFEGSISRDKMPFYLKNSKILALARPSSLQSTGGFPTKLGEYLSTKKPTIVTAVGDIPKYLEHRDNAFVVTPDDNNIFANNLSYIIDNYEEALEVAGEGYKLVMNVFNYKAQSIRLNDFLNSFK